MWKYFTLYDKATLNVLGFASTLFVILCFEDIVYH